MRQRLSEGVTWSAELRYHGEYGFSSVLSETTIT